ncbi:phage major capsid protein, P2 family [Larsenimonas rhizosphaerae]|uniref:phage major capsid protein, P2 family n=1 Tax=Larsenimonas rhizosphaerae TaxID=2944682 RepID=UPI002033FA58|nr:phage major capsid protein, P2 family [Larsenimonas rhizosphaerae]MCM2131476.1 phage major capsid protein, P2 family [Larsenimonas rhizosphaerae]
MRNDTRKKLNQYAQRLATLNNAENAFASFDIDATVQQTLETKIQESSEFLNRINMVGVRDLVGQKLGLGINGPIAARTDVGERDRVPTDPTFLELHDYRCESTEFDTYLTWAKLDAWAKFPDFQARVRDAIIRQQALDRIMIGFNGKTAAKQTNRTQNPLLQDVNIGWLQQYRLHAAARVFSDASDVTIGKGRTYQNLDALVFDAVNSLIEPWYRDSTDLVALVGRGLMTDKYLPMVNSWEQPTESRALDLIMAQKRIGGVNAMQVPFMPDGAIFITSLDNLSIYWQEGSRRRYLKDKPERKRVENFESSNDAYVVEDYGFGCLIENVSHADATDETAGA